MKNKSEIKEMILKEMSEKLDKVFDSIDESPKDLYQMEKIVSSMGSNIEENVLRAMEEYNQKNCKKKLPRMWDQTY